MIKILTASTYLPPIAGGAEQVVWEVAKKLADIFELHILTTGSRRLVDVKENITIHFVPRFPFLTLFYSSIGKFVINKILAEISPDIVRSHIVLPWGYVFHKVKAKRVITCHGSDVFPIKGYPKKFFLISALKNAHVITAPSKWLCNFTQRNYNVVCTVIPNGIDTNVFRHLENVRKQDNVVLFVGRFIQRKGILDLIDAAKALPEYEFWLVGNPKLKRSIKIPHLPNIRNIGFVSDIVEYYNKATICVFPSHWENFPIVGLEAMACGKAIVATNIGFSEYVENGREGVLIETGDIRGLVGSIRYLMENEDVRRRFEKNARKKALKYDWGIVAEQYRILYSRS